MQGVSGRLWREIYMTNNIRYSSSMNKITKAIIPVAGWGTRMLPITKSIEKSMLPVGKRPVIDYVVEDLVKAGITEIYFVVGENSQQIRTYYGENKKLEEYLEGKGRSDMLEQIAPPRGVRFNFLTQPSDGGYGTSVPVGIASELIEEDESALVIMGDQFFWREDGKSNSVDLIELVNQKGVTAGLFGNPIPWERVSQFGVIEKDSEGNFVRIVEKPKSDEAPSNLNNSSFYVFNKEIFELARTLPANPVRGEFEITDAISAYIANGGKIAVGEVKGEYMECGSVDGWLRANNTISDATD